MLELRDHNKVPPGGYVFEQRQGIYRKWEFSVDRPSRAKEISEFRAGNNLPRASLAEADEDLAAYTCERLGGMSEWCKDTDRPFVSRLVPKPSGCRGCGAKF